MVVGRLITDACFINTSEGYSKNVFIAKDIVVVPFINIGLMPENPINGKQSVVDYSYYIFKGVCSLFFNAYKGKLSVNFNNLGTDECITEYISLGGYQTENTAEVTVVCDALNFYLPDGAKIRDSAHHFIPADTPNFGMNMDIEDIDRFFLVENLPGEVKSIFDSENIYTLFLG